MKISPVVNNNKQNTNFGMLRVVDANTPKLEKEALQLLKKIAPVDCQPTRLRSILSGPKADELCFPDLLNTRDLPTYRKARNKVFLLGNEIDKYPSGGTITIGAWVKKQFKNADKISMKKLRALADALTSGRSAVRNARGELKKANENVASVQKEILAAINININ